MYPAIKWPLTISPHPKRFATLPCKYRCQLLNAKSLKVVYVATSEANLLLSRLVKEYENHSALDVIWSYAFWWLTFLDHSIYFCHKVPTVIFHIHKNFVNMENNSRNFSGSPNNVIILLYRCNCCRWVADLNSTSSTISEIDNYCRFTSRTGVAFCRFYRLAAS